MNINNNIKDILKNGSQPKYMLTCVYHSRCNFIFVLIILLSSWSFVLLFFFIWIFVLTAHKFYIFSSQTGRPQPFTRIEYNHNATAKFKQYFSSKVSSISISQPFHNEIAQKKLTPHLLHPFYSFHSISFFHFFNLPNHSIPF